MTMPATPADDKHEALKTRARKRGRWWLAALIAVVALVLAAPTIVCTTSLKDFCLTSALRARKVDGRASVGSLSMGWWSPVRIENFELTDREGQAMASIPALSVDRSLASLLLNRHDLGHIRVEQPTIDVRLTAPPADAERAIEEKVEPELAEAEKRAGSIGFDVEVVNATVRVHDTAAQRDWAIERVMLDVKQSGTLGDPLAVNVSAALPAAADEAAGQLKASARLQPASPWLLEFDAGRVIDHVRLTPEMCNAWMKYALPVLADVTESYGDFSVDLEGGRVPLAKPATGETAGFIAVHSVEVGPGPVANQFLSVVTTLAEALGREINVPTSRLTLAHDSKVEFRVVDGKVYHRGLRIDLPRLSIETYGAVGFDQSLEMMAEIRVTDPKLLQGPLAQVLASRPLQLPISGTLKKPVVDTQALRGLGREAIRDTAKELIGSKLERGLDRLLRKSRE